MNWTTNAKVTLPHDERIASTFFAKYRNVTLSKKVSATITQVIMMLLVSTIIGFYIQFSSTDPMVALVGLPSILKYASFVILLCMFFHTIKNYTILPLLTSTVAAIIFIIAIVLLAGTNPALQ